MMLAFTDKDGEPLLIDEEYIVKIAI